ncbi:hypothetical protein Mapa_017574 [Marchantia paleacea]|nr:hypothetical protein Mapa_017574 [Marchantia paleacea]
MSSGDAPELPTVMVKTAAASPCGLSRAAEISKIRRWIFFFFGSRLFEESILLLLLLLLLLQPSLQTTFPFSPTISSPLLVLHLLLLPSGIRTSAS